MFEKVCAAGLAQQKQSFYKTKGMGGGFEGGRGKKLILFLLLAQKCNAERTKLQHRSLLGHSPGEAACPNVGQSNDSQVQRGILPVNGGGGCTRKIAILRGGGRCAFRHEK